MLLQRSRCHLLSFFLAALLLSFTREAHAEAPKAGSEPALTMSVDAPQATDEDSFAEQLRRDDEHARWSAEYQRQLERPARISAYVLNVVGIGSMLSAGALEVSLLADEPTAPSDTYRRRKRAVGPLAGISVPFNMGSVIVGADLRDALPHPLGALNVVVGISSMIAGIILWSQPAQAIGDTGHRQPVHQGGSLLFCVGLPLALWGARDVLDHALRRSFGGH